MRYEVIVFPFEYAVKDHRLADQGQANYYVFSSSNEYAAHAMCAKLNKLSKPKSAPMQTVEEK
jgi:hypothetical protein